MYYENAKYEKKICLSKRNKECKGVKGSEGEDTGKNGMKEEQWQEKG